MQYEFNTPAEKNNWTVTKQKDDQDKDDLKLFTKQNSKTCQKQRRGQNSKMMTPNGSAIKPPQSTRMSTQEKELLNAENERKIL